MNERFPWHIFHPHNWCRLRAFSDLSHYLAKRFPPQLNHSRDAEPTWRYVTMTCQDDLLMTKVSLRSLAKHAAKLPYLIVAFDESLSLSVAKDAFSDWSGPIEFWSRKDVEGHYRSESPGIASFCREHIFGFKLAACCRASENSRVIYCDADVLWFRDFAKLMSEYKSHEIHVSTDPYCSLDERVFNVLPQLTVDQISVPPSYCAGFMIWNTHRVLVDRIEHLLNSFTRVHTASRFTEQTIVAALGAEFGTRIDLADVEMIEPGSVSLFPRSSPIARHYPTKFRPQFWLDRPW